MITERTDDDSGTIRMERNTAGSNMEDNGNTAGNEKDSMSNTETESAVHNTNTNNTPQMLSGNTNNSNSVTSIGSANTTMPNKLKLMLQAMSPTIAKHSEGDLTKKHLPDQDVDFKQDPVNKHLPDQDVDYKHLDDSDASESVSFQSLKMKPFKPLPNMEQTLMQLNSEANVKMKPKVDKPPESLSDYDENIPVGKFIQEALKQKAARPYASDLDDFKLMPAGKLITNLQINDKTTRRREREITAMELEKSRQKYERTRYSLDGMSSTLAGIRDSEMEGKPASFGYEIGDSPGTRSRCDSMLSIKEVDAQERQFPSSQSVHVLDDSGEESSLMDYSQGQRCRYRNKALLSPVESNLRVPSCSQSVSDPTSPQKSINTTPSPQILGASFHTLSQHIVSLSQGSSPSVPSQNPLSPPGAYPHRSSQSPNPSIQSPHTSSPSPKQSIQQLSAIRKLLGATMKSPPNSENSKPQLNAEGSKYSPQNDTNKRFTPQYAEPDGEVSSQRGSVGVKSPTRPEISDVGMMAINRAMEDTPNRRERLKLLASATKKGL